MAINYTWDVSTVDVTEIDGATLDTVSYVSHWRLAGTDDANNDAEWQPTDCYSSMVQ